jgi:hypothetical protein
MCADDAVERRDNIGIAVIDRRDPGVGLGLLQIGLGVVACRRRRIEGCLRGGLLGNQAGLTLEVNFGLVQG